MTFLVKQDKLGARDTEDDQFSVSYTALLNVRLVTATVRSEDTVDGISSYSAYMAAPWQV